MGTVYCNICGDHKDFPSDAQCPNDVIQETGYSQLENGMWICQECYETRLNLEKLRIHTDK